MSVSLRSALAFSTALVLATVTATAATTATIVAGWQAPTATSAAVEGWSPPVTSGVQNASEVSALATGPAKGTQTLFVPIVPCRIVDTRKAGGILTKNSSRSFYVQGATGFASQGGMTDGCGIPSYATAASFSFTTTESTGKGRLVAWPAGSAMPNATVTSYTNANKVTANPTIAVAAGAGKQLAVRNQDYATHLVIDVMGYYMPRTWGAINPNGTKADSTSTVLGTTRLGVGVYRISFAYHPGGCAAAARPADPGPFFANAYVSDQYVYVHGYASTTGAPTDMFFTFELTC